MSELINNREYCQEKIIEPEPGHPLHSFMLENRAIEKQLTRLKKAAADFQHQPSQDNLFKLRGELNLLWDLEKHYSRKENVLFPFLEKYEITGPSRIMWTQDDEIRELLKELKRILSQDSSDFITQLEARLALLSEKIIAMIAKEENVVFRTALKVLSEDEWYQILIDSKEIGYCLIEPQQKWHPSKHNMAEGLLQGAAAEFSNGYLRFDNGVLTPKEADLILNHLPIDITYVDKEGLVKYFSAGEERIFVRSRSIIGRKVENCHPPASVDIVEQLVKDFAGGRKNHEDFWLHLGEKYVWIRYVALRDSQGDFVGVMECTQNIQPLQSLTGEKRIAD